MKIIRNHRARAAMVAGIAALLATCLPTAAGSATAPSSGSTATQLQDDVSALVAAGAPGAVVIRRRGTRVEQFAGGVAQIASQIPMSPADRFRIGSLTKTYVATVMLQLVAAHKVALTDSVQRWLPGLVPGGARVTIRELLNHSSGLPEFDDDPRFLKPYLSGHLRYHWSPRALVKIAVSHKPVFAPGTRYSYSNTNYLLAGLVIEAVTRDSLNAQLSKRIFGPLHLTATTFQARAGLPAPYAHGYFTFCKPPPTDVSDLDP